MSISFASTTFIGYLHFFISICIIFLYSTPNVASLKCPCNIGPCPSVGTNESIVDTCARNYSHAYCVRTLNLTIQYDVVLKQREIYRCANFTTANHDMELMIHIPTNSSDQVTIEYRCRNQDYCSMEFLQDDDCDAAISSTINRQLADDSEKSIIRNLQPEIEKPYSDFRSCRCIDYQQIGKISQSQEKSCRWTNDVRRDSGRNLPYCAFGRSSPLRPDLRASIFCRGIGLSAVEGGRSILKNVPEEMSDRELSPRRFRCTMQCNYADGCNREEEFEKIYCAAMRQLKVISKNQPLTVLKSQAATGVSGARVELGPDGSRLSGEKAGDWARVPLGANGTGDGSRKNSENDDVVGVATTPSSQKESLEDYVEGGVDETVPSTTSPLNVEKPSGSSRMNPDDDVYPSATPAIEKPTPPVEVKTAGQNQVSKATWAKRGTFSSGVYICCIFFSIFASK